MTVLFQTLHNIADCRNEHEWTMGWLGKYWGCDKIVGGRTLKAMKQSHIHIFPRLFLSFIAWPNFFMKMGGTQALKRLRPTHLHAKVWARNEDLKIILGLGVCVTLFYCLRSTPTKIFITSHRPQPTFFRVQCDSLQYCGEFAIS